MDTLRTHKMRSALTVFGVVLGVGVIMLVAALITGFDYNIQEQIKQFGADTAFISKWTQGMHGAGDAPLEERLRKPLVLDDERAILPGGKGCHRVSDATLDANTFRANQGG